MKPLHLHRRDVLRLLLAPLVGALAKASQAAHSVTYRADAVILLLGVPVYSRCGVGGGYAEACPDGGGSYCLRFAGYSRPEQARGLDRSGYIEESIREENGALLSARYFGLMTNSKEDTVEQARQSLTAGANELSFAAIEGSSLPGSRTSSTSSFSFRRTDGEKDWRELFAAARHSLASSTRHCADAPASAYAAPTFLFCVRRAMADDRREMRQRFVYGDHEMYLDTERAVETGNDGIRALRITGRARKREHDSPAVFRIWFHEDACLPFRIDYQPRSFLRLSFVRVADDAGIRAHPKPVTSGVW